MQTKFENYYFNTKLFLISIGTDHILQLLFFISLGFVCRARFIIGNNNNNIIMTNLLLTQFL